MLITSNRLINTPVLSVQTGSAVGYISELIIDPDDLKIIAFILSGPLIGRSDANILDVSSVREYSSYGIIIDNIEELVSPDDVVKIKKILDLNFNLINLKVETKKGSKLGRVSSFTFTDNDFVIQQIIVKRPIVKSFIDPELTISRREIAEVTDYKIIIKDEEKAIKEKAAKEDFVPNFVNPFRKSEQDFVPAETQTPDDKDN